MMDTLIAASEQGGQVVFSASSIILIIIGSGTFAIALLAFLASVTNWFKRTIPIQFGFRVNDTIVTNLRLSTGDEAKPIFLRFHNLGRTSLTGLVLDIRFLNPITLSASQKALSFIPGKTIHGRTEDEAYYLIRYAELDLGGDDNLDFRVELNTKDKAPGTYRVLVSVYSTLQDYKYGKSELTIEMN